MILEWYYGKEVEKSMTADLCPDWCDQKLRTIQLSTGESSRPNPTLIPNLQRSKHDNNFLGKFCLASLSDVGLRIGSLGRA